MMRYYVVPAVFDGMGWVPDVPPCTSVGTRGPDGSFLIAVPKPIPGLQPLNDARLRSECGKRGAKLAAVKQWNAQP